MQHRFGIAALAGLVVACAVAAPVAAKDAGSVRPRGPADPNFSKAEPVDFGGGPGNWIDHFDTYATGSQLHGVGGWEGWDTSPAAGALTSATQSRSAANSVDILGAADLVQRYSGFTTGTWTYTAYQFIPSTVTGNTYFIILNTYAPPTFNWSTQICFNSTTDLVRDDVANNCTSGAQLPIIYDQWVELRVVINLDTDQQTFFYGGVQLYQAAWRGHVSTGGVLNIAAVDLFANTASSVFYDDISLSNLPFIDGFESENTLPWHLTLP